MKIRIITGVVAAAVVLPFLIFSDTVMMLILAVLLVGLGLGEMLHCIGVLHHLFVSIPTLAFGITMAVTTRLVTLDKWIWLFFILTFFLAVWLMVVSTFSHGKIDITNIGMTVMTTIYITLGFSSLVLLRDLKYGVFLFLIPLLTAWGSDIFAYFTGHLFGRHKLIPDVSPNKTVEGAIGGVVCGTALLVAYAAIIGYLTEAQPDYIAVIIAGVLMTIISQCGDLIASLIKRHYAIKDYGRLLPGHGGIMDRFDSVIAVSSLLFILYTISPFFNIFL